MHWRSSDQAEEVTDGGYVVRFRLSRRFFGHWGYDFTAAYWVDGLLIGRNGLLRAVSAVRSSIAKGDDMC